MNTPAVTGSKAFSFSAFDLYKLATGGAVGLIGILAAQLTIYISGGDFAAMLGDWAPLVVAASMASINTFVEVSKHGLDSKEAWKNAGWGAAIAGLSAGFVDLEGLAVSGEISRNPYMLLVYALGVNLLKRYGLNTEKPTIVIPKEPTQ